MLYLYLLEKKLRMRSIQMKSKTYIEICHKLNQNKINNLKLTRAIDLFWLNLFEWYSIRSLNIICMT